MNEALSAYLAPLLTRVAETRRNLDQHNKDSTAHPYEALPLAGRVLKAQQELIDELILLLDRRDPLNAECECEQRLAIHGRLNALAELRRLS